MHAHRGVPGSGCLGKLASNTVVSDLRASRAIDDVKQLTSPSSQTYSSFLPLYKSPARYVPVDVSIQGPSVSTNISWSGRARTRLPSSKTTLYLECTHASRKLRSRITGKCTSSLLRASHEPLEGPCPGGKAAGARPSPAARRSREWSPGPKPNTSQRPRRGGKHGRGALKCK